MKNNRFRTLFTIIIVLFAALLSAAQDTDSNEEIITIETKSVQTTLRVSNKKNKPASVKRDQLKLFVNGNPQEIAYFAADQVKKFTVLLDASDSMKGRRYERSLWFLNELAENSLPGQSFDVIVFAEKTQFIGNFTKSNKKEVFNKLKNLQPDGETALYDSVVECLKMFDKQIEPTALIVITDGGDNKSSTSTKRKANLLLSKFGTMTYLIVLDTKMAFRDPGAAPTDDIAKQAVKDFEEILQPVAFVVKNMIQFNQLADRLPREAGFLVKIGFDPDENILMSDKEIHKLEIVHSDSQLMLNYRQSFSVKGEK